MIVKMEQDSSVEEVEILIRYAEMSEDVERIATMLESATVRIKCSYDGGEKLVSVSDVYYFESVDKMTFVYCEKDVYRTELRLYQIVDDFAYMGFVQISKSCVLNINALDLINTLPNSRMEATLKNDERVYITRKYLDGIKHALQKGV
ncbi:MAG: LytTR family transcriptional regulator DNA-binding domain-containing protein [Defluviitaleaceae bacterium]|nr:LytTR family transcriptional regulator DNA-binding domain-containing protein [Defluviitaleaceae bacterium]